MIATRTAKAATATTSSISGLISVTPRAAGSRAMKMPGRTAKRRFARLQSNGTGLAHARDDFVGLSATLARRHHSNVMFLAKL